MSWFLVKLEWKTQTLLGSLIRDLRLCSLTCPPARGSKQKCVGSAGRPQRASLEAAELIDTGSVSSLFGFSSACGEDSGALLFRRPKEHSVSSRSRTVVTTRACIPFYGLQSSYLILTAAEEMETQLL